MTQNTTYGTRDRVDDVKNKAEDYKNRAADQALNVAQKVEDAANTVAQRGREAGEQVQEVAENFRTAFNKSMKEQPLTTLAMAAGVAFVLGALWKS